LLVHAFTAHRLGQAEIQNLDLTFRCYLDIAGLKVPVYHIMLVRCSYRLSYLQSN
jgi:hypothetical protein